MGPGAAKTGYFEPIWLAFPIFSAGRHPDGHFPKAAILSKMRSAKAYMYVL
jgi:hypothetical protein